MEQRKSKTTMNLASFFCVGAQKSGTTTLYEYLSRVSELYLPTQKETKFFVDDYLYFRGTDYYHSKFYSSANDKFIWGEIDPEYLYFAKVPPRLASYNSRAKIIMVFRNPIMRAYSHYLMSYRRGFENLSFQEAIYHEEKRLKSDNWLDIVHFSYVDRGFYTRQIERYLDVFPKDQLYFAFFDDLIENPEMFFQGITSFLDVSPLKAETEKKLHANPATSVRFLWLSRLLHSKNPARRKLSILLPKIPVIHKLTRQLERLNLAKDTIGSAPLTSVEYLASVYQDEIDSFSKLVGRDCSGWLDVNPAPRK